jgi:DNA polymerase-3 subunit epsilon
VAGTSPIVVTPDRNQGPTVTVEAAYGGELVRLSTTISTSVGESNGAYGATAEQLSRKLDEYAYVFSPVVPAEENFSPWFSGDPCPLYAKQRDQNRGDWIHPFMSPQVAALPGVGSLISQGVNGHKRLAVALRALIREKRKAKENPQELLHALYGVAVLCDLLESLGRERLTFFADLTNYVPFDELLRMRCQYAWMGYAKVPSLMKTDVKWLIAEFGEPSVHHSFEPLFDTLRRDAVRRFCRAEAIRGSKARLSPAEIEAGLTQVLRRKLELSISIDNENKARSTAVSTRSDRQAEALEALENVWEATNSDFVVADIETTGLDAVACEILELAALRVSPAGHVISEYSCLVQVRSRVPSFIAELTGITQAMVDEHGITERDAVVGLEAFVGQRPMFFHNSTFDTKFLVPAFERNGMNFMGPVIDTLPIARAAWPDMRSHKLSTLVKIIDGAPTPTHRALSDARATLAVLLAARALAGHAAAAQGTDALHNYPAPSSCL